MNPERESSDHLGILVHASPRTIQDVDRRRGSASRGQFVLAVLEEALTRSAVHQRPAQRPKATPQRKSRRYWTVDDDATLRRLHEAGDAISEIGMKLDRTNTSIDIRLRLHGLRPLRR